MEAKIEHFSAKLSKQNPVRSLQQELKKVSWTSKAELVFCTKVVIGAIFFFGIALFLVDLLIKGVLDLVSLVVRLILG